MKSTIKYLGIVLLMMLVSTLSFAIPNVSPDAAKNYYCSNSYLQHYIDLNIKVKNCVPVTCDVTQVADYTHGRSIPNIYSITFHKTSDNYMCHAVYKVRCHSGHECFGA